MSAAARVLTIVAAVSAASAARAEDVCRHEGEGFVVRGLVTVEHRDRVTAVDCGIAGNGGVPFVAAGTLLHATTTEPASPRYLFCPGASDGTSTAPSVTIGVAKALASEYRQWYAPVVIDRPNRSPEVIGTSLWIGRTGASRVLGWSCDKGGTDFKGYEALTDGAELCPNVFLKKKDRRRPELEYRAPDGTRVCVRLAELVR